MELVSIKKGKKLAQPQYSVCYCTDDSLMNVMLPVGIPTRDEVINVIITNEYPRDRMEAVVNNYLLDMTDECAIAEFCAMQEYRREAKALADEILEQLNNESQ